MEGDEKFSELLLEVDVDLINLYVEWELSNAGINALSECSIKTTKILQMMNIHDIDDVFNTRALLADKITFRYNLQKWRSENNYPPLFCCASDRPQSNTVSNLIVSQPSPTPPPKESLFSAVDFNIEDILKNAVAGKDMLRKYKFINTLDETDQASIVRIIVDWFSFNDIKMNPKTMTKVAEEIVKLFPTENVLTYYVPRGSRGKPSGKIYDRYFNSKYKRRVSGISSVASSSKKRKDSSDTDTESSKEILHDNIEYEKTKKWLLLNTPKDIETPWKETSSLRMKEPKCLKSMFENWPGYEDSKGPELIDIDFETLYPGKGNMLFEKIFDIKDKLIQTIFPSFIKDKLSMQYFHTMQSDELATDSKHFYFFNLLHATILPPRISKYLKPSIWDAQIDMIVRLPHLSNFKQKENEMRQLAGEEGLQLLPKVIVVGESISHLTEFYVYLNGILYTVPSLLRAVDVIIKARFVFDVDFSTKSKYVWIFLQEIFYGIPPDEKIPKIQNILTKLNNV